jgi:hypothetical protein
MISVIENALHQLMVAATNLKAEAGQVDMTGWRLTDRVEVTQQEDGSFVVRVIEPDTPKSKRKVTPVGKSPAEGGTAA